MKGDAILTSQRLDFLVRPKEPVSERTILIHHIRPIDLETAVPVDEAIRRVLEFVGPRPLIGYFLEFDVGMLEQVCPPADRAPACPIAEIEVSRLYYDWRAAPGAARAATSTCASRPSASGSTCRAAPPTTRSTMRC